MWGRSLCLLTLVAYGLALPDLLRAYSAGDDAKKPDDGVLLQARDATNDLFDVIFADMRQAIAANGLDPLTMPSDQDTFTVTLFESTLNGSVWLGDGSITGLATVHRTGNMTLDYGLLENELIVGGLVGLTGLQLQYSGITAIGPMGSDFSFSFGIPFLSLDFKTDIFISQADAILEYCFIQDFSYSHLTLEGFGPVSTSLYDLVANALLQAFNDKVQEKLETVVCSLLEQAIQGSG